jgi:hypothetical protein
VTNEDCNLEILEMIVQTSQPINELVNEELQIFQSYQMIVKNICVLWNGGRNMSQYSLDNNLSSRTYP